MEVERRENCSICGSSRLSRVIDLGPAPLANSYRTEEELQEGEKFYPMKVCRCHDCGLVQLREVVDRGMLFRSYDYISGETSESLPQHFQDYARSVLEKTGDEDSFIVGIGSNDGTLLKAFQEQGAEILGVDPADNVAEIAEERGVETIAEFFDSDLAGEITEKRSEADIVVANNVLGHVDDIHSVIEGVSALLKEGGNLFFEVPYLFDMLEGRKFDTIYHEHLYYYSAKPLLELFRQHGMSLMDVERIDVQGGSIRCRAVNELSSTSREIQEMVEIEETRQLYEDETYREFRRDVRGIRQELCRIIDDIWSDEHRIAGYGAPAKASVLLNYCNLGNDEIEFATDEIPEKQGKYIPGTSIPVVPTQKFREEDIDYCLLLAWNYAEEIIEKEEEFLESGGKFIIPFPEPRVVGGENADRILGKKI